MDDNSKVVPFFPKSPFVCPRSFQSTRPEKMSGKDDANDDDDVVGDVNSPNKNKRNKKKTKTKQNPTVEVK